MSSPDTWTLKDIYPLDRDASRRSVRKCREDKITRHNRLRRHSSIVSGLITQSSCNGECQDPLSMQLLIDRRILYQDLHDLLSCDNLRKLSEVDKLYLQTVNIDKSDLGQIRSCAYYYLIISMFSFLIFGIVNLEANATFCLGLVILGLNLSLFVYFVKKSSSVIDECREQFYDLSKVRRIVKQIETINVIVWKHKCQKEI